MKNKQVESKLKIKYMVIYAFLYSARDEKNGKTMSDIAAELEKNGISCDKRILNKEITHINKLMCEMYKLYSKDEQVDGAFKENDKNNVILKSIGSRNRYIYRYNKKSPYARVYGKHTDLDNGELRFLYDAVLSADFMTEEMVNGLCEKIKDTASSDCADYFVKHTTYSDHNRYHTNKDVLRWADELCKIIAENKGVLNGNVDDDEDWGDDEEYGEVYVKKPKNLTAVTYEYGNLNSVGELKFKDNHTVLPIALVFNRGYYYIVSMAVNSSKLHSYRLDRIMSMQRQDFPLKKLTYLQRGKFNEYNTQENQMLLTGVSMWGSEGKDNKNIILKFDKSLIGDIYDRYGKKVPIKAAEDNWYTADVRETNVNAFLAWVFQFGNLMQILPTTTMLDKFEKLVREVCAVYKWEIKNEIQ